MALYSLEETLLGLYSEVLEVTDLGVEDDFFEHGGHSLLAFQLGSLLERTLGVNIPLQTIMSAPTVSSLAKVIGTERAPGGDFDPVLTLKSAGSREPLWCVHAASGIGWAYRRLAPHLPDRPIIALQARGLAGDEFASSFGEMVENYTTEILERQEDGPFHLLGWSFGATVAHAVAIELAKRGHRIAFLGVLDGYPADVLADRVPADRDTLRREAETALVGRFRASEGDSSLGQRIIDTFVHNSMLARSAHAGRYAGDALIVAAARDGEGHPAKDRSPELERLWAPFISGSISMAEIDCTHYEIELPGPMKTIGQMLSDWL